MRLLNFNILLLAFLLSLPHQAVGVNCFDGLIKLSRSVTVQLENESIARVRVTEKQHSLALPTETVIDRIAQPLVLSPLSEVLTQIKQDKREVSIFQKTSEAMGLRVTTDGLPLSQVPQTGPLLIIANHPLSGVDGMALASEISKLRADTKVVLNKMLQVVPGVAEVSIGVDVTNPTSRDNIIAFREMNQWVKDGHALIIFPAGNVSRRQADGTISDTAWSKSIVKITQKSNAQVLPVFVHGKPGTVFNLIDRVSPSLAGSWVPMEIIRQKNSSIHLTFGNPIEPEKIKSFNDDDKATDFLRAHTYYLERKQP